MTTLPTLGADRRPWGSRLFYGWIMVAASFVVQGVGIGNQYLLGLFLPLFKDKFSTSSAQLLLATSGSMTIAFGVLAPFYGILAQRIPLRYLMSFSILCVAIAYIGLAHAGELWQVMAIYSVLFSLGSLGGIVSAPALVTNWFSKSRGLALGIAAAGISAAGFLGPPLVAAALTNIGLQKTLIAVGIVVALLLPLHWVIVDRPEDIGLGPDGKQGLPDTQSPNSLETATARPHVRAVLAAKAFWIVMVVTAIPTAIISALLPTLASIAEHVGVSKQVAAYLVSAAAVTAMVGKISLGWLFDRWSQRTIALITVVLLAFACGSIAGHPSLMQLIVGSVLLGGGVGATILIQNILSAAAFGRQGFVVVIGAITPITMVLTLASLWAIGHAFDSRGSYDAALLEYITALAFTALIAFLLPARSQKP